MLEVALAGDDHGDPCRDRKSTRLNSSHQIISYAVFCLKKKNTLLNSVKQIKFDPLYHLSKKDALLQIDHVDACHDLVFEPVSFLVQPLPHIFYDRTLSPIYVPLR